MDTDVTLKNFLQTNGTTGPYITQSQYSDDEQYKRFLKDIPSVIFLLLVSFIGTFGNIHASLVYWFRFQSSCYRTIVMALSAVDLFMCAIAVPHDIIDLRFNTNGRFGSSCRLFIYIDFFLSFVSVSYLTFIAIHRYRKVCRPLRRQFTLKQVKVILVLTFIVCGVIALLVLWFFRRDPSASDYTTNCLDLDSPGIKLGFQLYIIFIDVTSLGLLIICIVCYFFVLKTLRFRMKTNAEREILTPKENTGSNLEIALPLEFSSQSKASRETSTFPGTLARMKEKDDSQRQRSLRITSTFVVASAISFGSWMTSITIVSAGTFGLSLPSKLGAAYTIIECSHYLNHMANPIVYCVIDIQFRKECVELYKHCFTRCNNLINTKREKTRVFDN